MNLSTMITELVTHLQLIDGRLFTNFGLSLDFQRAKKAALAYMQAAGWPGSASPYCQSIKRHAVNEAWRLFLKQQMDASPPPLFIGYDLPVETDARTLHARRHL